jgi:hypothetical protein
MLALIIINIYLGNTVVSRNSELNINNHDVINTTSNSSTISISENVCLLASSDPPVSTAYHDLDQVSEEYDWSNNENIYGTDIDNREIYDHLQLINDEKIAIDQEELPHFKSRIAIEIDNTSSDSIVEPDHDLNCKSIEQSASPFESAKFRTILHKVTTVLSLKNKLQLSLQERLLNELNFSMYKNELEKLFTYFNLECSENLKNSTEKSKGSWRRNVIIELAEKLDVKCSDS